MERRHGRCAAAANLGCIVWLVILGVVGYLLYKVVPVKIATSEFYDTMQEQAAFGSIKDVQVHRVRDPAEGRAAAAPDQEGKPQDHEVARGDHGRSALRDHDRLLQRRVQVRLEVRSGGAATVVRGVRALRCQLSAVGAGRGLRLKLAADADSSWPIDPDRLDLRRLAADRDPRLDPPLLRAGAARASSTSARPPAGIAATARRTWRVLSRSAG